MDDEVNIEEQQHQPSTGTAAEPEPTRISPRTVLESISALRIEKERIKPLESDSWGRGGNADVIPAELLPTDAPGPSSSGDVQHVAVKKLKLDEDIDDTRILASLFQEIHLLNKLSHKNIVQVIGFVENTSDGIAWIILPWEQNGNLREFVASADWDFPERIALLHDVADGMKYLHSREPPICHGDLKSLNVLVNSKNEAFIIDFGSARSVESTSKEVAQPPDIDAVPYVNLDQPKVEVVPSGGTITLTAAQWTLRWAAPELLAGGVSDLMGDIWAFGWICWEVMTSNFPFEGKNDVSVVVQIIQGNLPPVHGDGRLDQVTALANLMIDCWSLEPGKRPTAASCERQIYWMGRATPCSRSGSDSPEIRSAQLLSSLAFMHISHGRLSVASELLNRAVHIACSTKNDQTTAEIARRAGEIYRLRGEYSPALELYTISRNIYSRIGYPAISAHAVKVLGDIYLMRGEYATAEQSYNTARETFTRLNHQLGLASAATGLGNVYRLRDENSQAEESYTMARDIYVELGSQRHLASVTAALGDLCHARGETPKAVKSYAAAREIYTRIGDQFGIAEVVTSIGEVYRVQGEVSKAEEYCLIARDIYTQLGDGHGLANTFTALGDVYASRRKYAKAEEFYLIAHKKYNRLGGQLGLGHVSISLGGVYRLTKKYSKAEESYLAAREIFTRIGSQVGLGNALNGLGQLYSKQNDYTKAEKSYQDAREIYTRIGIKVSLAQNLRNIGWLHRDLRRYEEAECQFAEASTLFKELGMEEDVLDCDEIIEEVRKEKLPSLWTVLIQSITLRFKGHFL